MARHAAGHARTRLQPPPPAADNRRTMSTRRCRSSAPRVSCSSTGTTCRVAERAEGEVWCGERACLLLVTNTQVVPCKPLTPVMPSSHPTHSRLPSPPAHPTHLWQVGHEGQPHGLDDLKQRGHRLAVQGGGAGLAQHPHQRVDGHLGAGGWEWVGRAGGGQVRRAQAEGSPGLPSTAALPLPQAPHPPPVANHPAAGHPQQQQAPTVG